MTAQEELITLAASAAEVVGLARKGYIIAYGPGESALSALGSRVDALQHLCLRSEGTRPFLHPVMEQCLAPFAPPRGGGEW